MRNFASIGILVSRDAVLRSEDPTIQSRACRQRTVERAEDVVLTVVENVPGQTWDRFRFSARCAEARNRNVFLVEEEEPGEVPEWAHGYVELASRLDAAHRRERETENPIRGWALCS